MSMEDDIQDQASSLYMKLFSQYDSRLKWDNIRDLQAKDKLRQGILAPRADPISVTAKKHKRLCECICST